MIYTLKSVKVVEILKGYFRPLVFLKKGFTFALISDIL